MWLLASFLNIVVGSSLAGVGVIVALVVGFDTITGVLGAATIGYALSLPVSWLIARQLMSLREGQRN